MGFRSTFTTSDYSIKWPEWFKEKYKDTVAFRENGVGALHSIFECKTYMTWDELHTDIQKAIDWNDFGGNFVLVYLHECNGITRCQIDKDAIIFTEPVEWRKSDGVEHHYCYGCSDA